MIQRIKKIKRIVRKFIIKLYWQSTIRHYEADYFSGKTIAIIGGGDTALQEKNGYYIDSFDIVIRINRGIDNYLDKSEYLGSRTDILFHGLHEDPFNGCGPVKPKEWLKKGVKKVIFPLVGIGERALIDTYILRSKGRLPLLRLNAEEYNEITKVLKGFRTTTGFAAIYLMTKVKFKRLYITGFTFFKTPHQAGYNDNVSIDLVRENIKKFKHHNPDLEYEYFKKAILKVQNIEIDKGMESIFQRGDVNPSITDEKKG